MPIGTGHFGKALEPGVNIWWGKTYDEFPVEYTSIYEIKNSRRAFEEAVSVSGLGLAPIKRQGAPVTYDTEEQGFVTRFNHIVYALGFVITQEMMDDDMYDVVGERRAGGLAFSMRQTKEIVHANVLNRAFDSNFKGGDSVEMCATTHPNIAGGTFANELTTAADLSEASLEQACIDIAKLRNDRNLRISAMPESLIIPVDLMFEVTRILESEYRSGTADNDVNALKVKGMIRNVIVNHYLTDTDAWFIKTNVKNGLISWQRKPMEFKNDSDFDSDNAKFKASERYSAGWVDPRGIFGSPGA